MLDMGLGCQFGALLLLVSPVLLVSNQPGNHIIEWTKSQTLNIDIDT
jgi:hypothetical protein